MHQPHHVARTSGVSHGSWAWLFLPCTGETALMMMDPRPLGQSPSPWAELVDPAWLFPLETHGQAQCARRLVGGAAWRGAEASPEVSVRHSIFNSVPFDLIQFNWYHARYGVSRSGWRGDFWRWRRRWRRWWAGPPAESLCPRRSGGGARWPCGQALCPTPCHRTAHLQVTSPRNNHSD